MASGVKRYFAGPVRNTTGTKTMQIDRVETKAGVAICWAPSRIACTNRLPRPRFRWMFSISTVASSTRMPTASASPPSVITLSAWPIALAVGILVDDATVEIENIHRNLGQRKPILQAILDGAQQIAIPTFVATLS